MKIKKSDSNNVLNNKIYKHIILEAPTPDELEKKIKKYETILARALTNLYQISDMTLERDNLYYLTPSGSYQTAISFHFYGSNRKNVPEPEQTLKYLEQLTMLETDPKYESKRGISSHSSHKEDITTEEVNIEVDSLKETEGAICNRQRQILEDLIKTKNLVDISFCLQHKLKNPETNKINVSMSCVYRARAEELNKSVNNSSAHDEH